MSKNTRLTIHAKGTAMRTAFVFVVAIFFAGCGGPLFGVNLFVVGEQTSLEKQVLGTYSALTEDLLIYSSVRAVDPDGDLQPPPPATDSQGAAFAAMRNREYNRDDVVRMLRIGVVGEGNAGMLVTREPNTAVPNLTTSEVQSIINEENSDREVILGRLLTTTVGVSPEDSGEVAWVFARLNQDSAPQGTWIQNRSGEWVRK